MSRLQPKHVRRVNDVYPAHAGEEGPVGNKLSILMYYINARPIKLLKVMSYLEKKVSRDIYKERVGNHKVTLDIIDGLSANCSDHFGLFATPALRIINALSGLSSSEQTPIDLTRKATESFVKLIGKLRTLAFFLDNASLEEFDVAISRFLTLVVPDNDIKLDDNNFDKNKKDNDLRNIGLSGLCAIASIPDFGSRSGTTRLKKLLDALIVAKFTTPNLTNDASNGIELLFKNANSQTQSILISLLLDKIQNLLENASVKMENKYMLESHSTDLLILSIKSIPNQFLFNIIYSLFRFCFKAFESFTEFTYVHGYICLQSLHQSSVFTGVHGAIGLSLYELIGSLTRIVYKAFQNLNEYNDNPILEEEFMSFTKAAKLCFRDILCNDPLCISVVQKWDALYHILRFSFYEEFLLIDSQIPSDNFHSWAIVLPTKHESAVGKVVETRTASNSFFIKDKHDADDTHSNTLTFQKNDIVPKESHILKKSYTSLKSFTVYPKQFDKISPPYPIIEPVSVRSSLATTDSNQKDLCNEKRPSSTTMEISELGLFHYRRFLFEIIKESLIPLKNEQSQMYFPLLFFDALYFLAFEKSSNLASTKIISSQFLASELLFNVFANFPKLIYHSLDLLTTFQEKNKMECQPSSILYLFDQNIPQPPVLARIRADLFLFSIEEITLVTSDDSIIVSFLKFCSFLNAFKRYSSFTGNLFLEHQFELIRIIFSIFISIKDSKSLNNSSPLRLHVIISFLLSLLSNVSENTCSEALKACLENFMVSCPSKLATSISFCTLYEDFQKHFRFNELRGNNEKSFHEYILELKSKSELIFGCIGADKLRDVVTRFCDFIPNFGQALVENADLSQEITYKFKNSNKDSWYSPSADSFMWNIWKADQTIHAASLKSALKYREKYSPSYTIKHDSLKNFVYHSNASDTVSSLISTHNSVADKINSILLTTPDERTRLLNALVPQTYHGSSSMVDVRGNSSNGAGTVEPIKPPKKSAFGGLTSLTSLKKLRDSAKAFAPLKRKSAHKPNSENTGKFTLTSLKEALSGGFNRKERIPSVGKEKIINSPKLNQSSPSFQENKSLCSESLPPSPIVPERKTTSVLEYDFNDLEDVE